jgi:hypothetical protein
VSRLEFEGVSEDVQIVQQFLDEHRRLDAAPLRFNYTPALVLVQRETPLANFLLKQL